MPHKKQEMSRVQTNSLNADEAEELFSQVDETGHTNAETAAKERRHRHDTGSGVDVDPLADEDPSGSNVGRTITKVAVWFVVIFFVIIVGSQILFGFMRRSNTANLSQSVNVRTVASAISGGVEWGNGFTQFPEDFSVQEADENTGRVEVTVVDTTSETVLECLAGSQVQAAALATNSLLNQNINTVTYHVQVHLDENGKILTSSFFGFFKPQGEVTSLMTFVWTKTTDQDGAVHFNCTISGIDDELQEVLRDQIANRFTPQAILGINGDAGRSVTVQSETDDSTDSTTSSDSSASTSDATGSSSATSSDDSSVNTTTSADGTSSGGTQTDSSNATAAAE